MKNLCRHFITSLTATLTLSTLPTLAAEKPDFESLEKKLQSQIQLHKDDQTPAQLQKKRNLENILTSVIRAKTQLEASPNSFKNQKFRVSSHHQLPLGLTKDVTILEAAFEQYIEDVKKERKQARYQAIDSLIKQTQQLCNNSPKVEGLEALLVELVSLGSSQSNYSQNPFDTRYKRKYDGLLNTLQSWLRHLEFKNAQNVEQANTQLKSLLKSRYFPVLHRDTIQAALLPDTQNPHSVTTIIYTNIEGIDDLAKALTNLKKVEQTRANDSSSKSTISRIKAQLDYLKIIDENLTTSDGTLALSLLKKSPLSPNEPHAKLMFDKMKSELEYLYLSKKNLIPKGVTPAKHEDARLFLTKVFDKQLTEKDYGTALNTSLLITGLPYRQKLPTHYDNDRQALSAYLKGLQLEKAGDHLMALTHYRKCSGISGTKNAPITESLEAIARIAAKHPEFITDTNSILIERINQLELQLKRLPLGRYR